MVSIPWCSRVHLLLRDDKTNRDYDPHDRQHNNGAALLLA